MFECERNIYKEVENIEAIQVTFHLGGEKAL